ncbi:MAG: hypothetical protein COC08_08735 [Maribacter sp.]|nr:MAG: hypothetical protein COC08_08735 [Maribacter sp.]
MLVLLFCYSKDERKMQMLQKTTIFIPVYFFIINNLDPRVCDMLPKSFLIPIAIGTRKPR